MTIKILIKKESVERLFFLYKDGPVRFTHRLKDELFESLERLAGGLEMTLVDLSVSRSRGSVQVRLTVYRPGNVGIDDCSALHRAALPRLELAFPGAGLYVEVSSPGIDRAIRDGSEFAHYIGRGVRCFRTDISDWYEGVLLSSDEEKIVVKGKDGETTLSYEVIAKAKLCDVPGVS
ncbi:MAG: ribosome assembly cofactor RimP [Spirochaetaceae bacterium]|nr:ribosome assembly cofactor RimP [Spirochaetaceae bacterium]